MATLTLEERMARGCLLNIPNSPCTRCDWDPDVDGNGLWPSLGGLAVRWIRENLIFGEGDFFGQPFVVLPDQKLFLYRWYEYCPRCEQWRFAEALRFEATGGGKAVALDTPIPTPNGWTTMGEVQVGDQIFDELGLPTTVIQKSPVYTDHACYKVRFEGGEEIIADSDHLWQFDHWNGSKWVPRTLTTGEVVREGVFRAGRRVWRVREGGSLQLPERDLPLDPWLLGFWLGDGDSDQPHLTVGDQDLKAVVSRLERDGWDLTWLTRQPGRAQKLRVKGLLPILRQLGVLGRKHVPEAYLRASEAQRRELLTGLMDSDGSCHRSRCEFSNTNRELAEAVFELISSLGVRATFSERSDHYRVTWTAQGSFFGLERKQANVPETTRTAHRRMVISIEPVPTVPVQCLTVDSPNHLYRIGRSMVVTHNTQFIAAIVLLEFAGPPEIANASPNIPIAAASWDQADLCFGQAAVMVGGKDDDITEAPLCGQFDVFDTEIRFKGSRPGKIYRVAAVAGTNEGGLPTLFVCDELHEWGDIGTNKARTHTVIGKSTTKRKQQNPDRGRGRILNISTAGFSRENSLLGRMYDRCKKILMDPSLDPRFLVNIYEARPGLDFNNPKDRETAARDASPAAGIIWDVADRVNEWGKIENHEWIRYYANTWPEITEDSWLKDHPQAWDHCYGVWESAPDSNPWVLAVDMALYQDSVAVNRLEWLPDDRIAVTAKIWASKDYGGRIPHDEVWAYIKSQAVGVGFRGVVYDPRFFEVPARLLELDRIPVIEFGQTADQMAPAAGLTYKMILEQQIVHNGQDDLKRHVRTAVAVPMERGGFVLKKGPSKGKIDACIAMVMGVQALHHLPKTLKPMFAWA